MVSKARLDEEFGGGLAGIARNITDLKKAVWEAEHARKVAEHASQAKNDFLAKMSHEVRTPLNGIMGISRLLMHAENQLATREQLKIIYSSAEALLALMGDILNLTDIESGQVSLHTRRFSLSTLLSDAENLIFMEGDNTRFAVVKHVDTQIPDQVKGDPGKLRQILINLLSNARKFTGKGQIIMSVTMLERKQSTLRVQFQVEDEGVGVAEDDQKTIFDRFGQADNSLSRRFGGSGLGLSICRELVELLGGELSIESPSKRSGCGSIFRFTTELHMDTPDRQSEEGPPFEFCLEELSKVSREKKLLLVEDNPVNQQIALAMLHKAGLQADVAENGQLALNALDDQSYDLVLMDLQMPIMDGLSATRHIRSNSAFADLPIVALTAQVLEGDRESCLEAGMNDYLPKPIEPEWLYRTLHRYLCQATSGNRMPES